MRVDILPLTSIVVGKRFRENYGDIDGLAQSIRDKGIITPLAVSLTVGSSGQEVFNLLAGGRRYEACRVAGIETVPVRIYDRPLSELELRSIELEENIQRKDLDWVETVNLQREIHELRQKLHGPKISTAPDAPGWSLRDTATLLGKSAAGLSMDVKLANAIEQMPNLEWNECRNKSDAMKLLARVEEAAIKRELAKRADAMIKSTTPVGGLDARRAKLAKSYAVVDFFVAARSIDPGIFNLVEVDPPYAIKLHAKKHKDGPSLYDYSDDGYNEISEANYPSFIFNLLTECYRMMADNSWLLLWFGPTWFELMHRALLETGFSTTPLVGLWVKPQGQTNQPNTYLGSSYEMFFYAWKGSPTLAKPGTLNTFHFSQTHPSKKIHPTERPLDLITTLLSTFAFPNSRVLVPFAGSGNTLLAAQKLGMHPIGFDLSSQFRDAFVTRVMEEQL